MRRWGLLLAYVLATAWPQASAAHPGHDERLARLDAAIEREPNQALLLVRRGVLHCEHARVAEAEQDFRRARRGAKTTEHEPTIARAWLRADQPRRAVRAADRRLRAQPDDAQARWLRGIALARQGRGDDARPELDRAIALMPHPRAHHYLERSRVMRASPSADEAAILAGLRAGIERLGPRVELVNAAVASLVALDRPAPALALLDRLPPRLRESPRWRGRRGDLLALAGSIDQARLAYRAALATLERLPTARRSTPAFVALHADLKARLSALGSPSTG